MSEKASLPGSMKVDFVLNCCRQTQAMKMFLKSFTNQSPRAVKPRQGQTHTQPPADRDPLTASSFNGNLWVPVKQSIFFLPKMIFHYIHQQSVTRHWANWVTPLQRHSWQSTREGKDHCTLSPSPSMHCALQQDVLSGSACWQSPRPPMFTHKHAPHRRSLFDF